MNTLIKRASLHLQQGKKDEALQDLNDAEAVDPENADVYHHRAQVRLLLRSISAFIFMTCFIFVSA